MATHGPLSHAVLGLPTRRPGQRAQLAALPVMMAGDLPTPPDSLSDAGRRGWTDALSSAPWLTAPVDLVLLEQWALLLDEAALLRGRLARGARTTRGSRGQRVDEPIIPQLRAVENGLLKFAQTLGLGPMNRARLNVPLAPPTSPSQVTGDDRAAARAALAASR